MIEQWFREDIEAAFKRSDRFTICDPEGVMTFLLDTLIKDHLVYSAASDVEELEIKYRVEKEHTDQKVILHVRRDRTQMKFLREYFETGERLHVHGLPRYVRDKVHQHLRLNLLL
ncbi:MAG: hypothetical protein IPJ06_14895, partial [Saprospiraceae bacterium]|nr:hypothetical protein [Saprospiraceae bacterium]